MVTNTFITTGYGTVASAMIAEFIRVLMIKCNYLLVMINIFIGRYVKLVKADRRSH